MFSASSSHYGLVPACSHFSLQMTLNYVFCISFLWQRNLTELKCRLSFVSVNQIIVVKQNSKVFKGGVFIYSSFLSTAYSTFYIMGLILSMQIPFVGFQPIRTSEHMAAAGKSHPLYFSECLIIRFSWKNKFAVRKFQHEYSDEVSISWNLLVPEVNSLSYLSFRTFDKWRMMQLSSSLLLLFHSLYSTGLFLAVHCLSLTKWLKQSCVTGFTSILQWHCLEFNTIWNILSKVRTITSQPSFSWEIMFPGGTQNCTVTPSFIGNESKHWRHFSLATTLFNQYLLHTDRLKQKSCLLSLKAT